MTLAVLADVHGNLPALEAVLADIEAQAPDAVVVNGDMVNRGPDGVAVMERLAATGWPMLLGNHDDLVRMWVQRDRRLPAGWFDDPLWGATSWCALRLQEAGWIERLATLPMTWRSGCGGDQDVLVAHGSPRHYREGFGKHLSNADISEITEMHPAAVLIGSHTHRPLRRRWGRYLVLNTGAVGTPFNADPRAQYLLLHAHADGWRPEFRALPYDREAALGAFEASGFNEGGGFSARVFQLELATARSLLVPFLMWSEEQGRAPDPAAWRAYRRRFAARFVAADGPGRVALEAADAELLG